MTSQRVLLPRKTLKRKIPQKEDVYLPGQISGGNYYNNYNTSWSRQRTNSKIKAGNIREGEGQAMAAENRLACNEHFHVHYLINSHNKCRDNEHVTETRGVDQRDAFLRPHSEPQAILLL